MKNKKLLILSIFLAIAVIVGIYFFVIKEGVPPVDGVASNDAANSSQELVTNTINNNTTTSGNLFYNSSSLITKESISLRPETLSFVKNRIAKYEAEVKNFDSRTDLVTKVNTYFAISADYKTLGEYGIAKDFLEKAMTVDPKNSNLMQFYSSLLSVMGDKKAALAYIDKAISLYSAEANYWLWKIDLEKDLGATSTKIESIYKDSIAKTKSVTMITAYASFLESQNRKSEAIVQWQKAIELYPQNKNAYQAEIDKLI
jgi:tetratricopeptide (TPR) repeat protein